MESWKTKKIKSDLVKLKVGGDPVHEADEAPEGVNLVLHHKEKRGEEVGHTLQLTTFIMCGIWFMFFEENQ